MATDSGARFIRRNRAPRVHISYEDPYDAERQIELPFVMGVLADLSGNNPGVEKPDVANRKFLDIDMDNFDNRMAAIEPGVSFRVANKLGEGAEGGSEGDKLSVSLRFKKMDDFTPGKVARQVPPVGQTSAGARATLQPAAVYGRKGRRRRSAQEALARPVVDGGAEGPCGFGRQ